MAGERGWIPEDIDVRRPSSARIYDYALGGGHNLASDRAAFDELIKIQPKLREMAWTNRAFLRRVVLFMVKSGIRQFLDLGSGIPTVGNVHEIAQKADPETHVVYVDRDDVAVAHSQLLLECNPLATIVEADITRPGLVLRHPDTLRLLDFDRPIGILALTIGHYIQQHEVQEVFGAYRDAVAPGSMLGLSHITDDFEQFNEAVATASKASGDGYFPRSKDEIQTLFGDFELCEPGVVPPSIWHPEPVPPMSSRPEEDGFYAGVAIKRPAMTPDRTVPD
jgi:hypothetical protein